MRLENDRIQDVSPSVSDAMLVPPGADLIDRQTATSWVCYLNGVSLEELVEVSFCWLPNVTFSRAFSKAVFPSLVFHSIVALFMTFFLKYEVSIFNKFSENPF